MVWKFLTGVVMVAMDVVLMVYDCYGCGCYGCERYGCERYGCDCYGWHKACVLGNGD